MYDTRAADADVYEELEESHAKKTTYILQFMWRDISSKYDVVGLVLEVWMLG